MSGLCCGTTVNPHVYREWEKWVCRFCGTITERWKTVVVENYWKTLEVRGGCRCGPDCDKWTTGFGFEDGTVFSWDEEIA